MNTYNVLLLGSGGRESALAWKLSQSPLLKHLFIAPGNGGTGAYGTNVALNPMDFNAVAGFITDKAIDLLIVGNEDPLVAGISDFMAHQLPGLLVMGPSKAAAALEGSKAFAKDFMKRHNIPTAAYRQFSADEADEAVKFLADLPAGPYVLKADGLAAGKGVLIINDLAEAQDALRQMLGGMFGAASATVVVEQFLDGIECSVFVITDGNGAYRLLPVAKDYKRIGEGDTGLNTGGMGAVSPVCFADVVFMEKVENRIIRPTVNGLVSDRLPYRGFIFFGLINVGGDPMVIEYNVRMGDPETEVVMPRLDSDLLALCLAAARGDLADTPCVTSPLAATTVIAVSGGYPGSYAKGLPVTGNLSPEHSILFHAGTRIDTQAGLVTSGGRVIAATSLAPSVSEALAHSYRTLADIHFDGMYYRRDIGSDLLALANTPNP